MIGKMRKRFEKFADIIEKNDSHKKFYEQFGKFLKHAIHEDSTNQREITQLDWFSNSKSGVELNRLQEHVDCF